MEEEQPIKRGFFAMIPSVVLSDKRLTPNAKLIFGEIYSLADENGTCFPNNQHFADLLGISTRQVQENISSLIKLGLIVSDTQNNNQRTMKISSWGYEENLWGVRGKPRGGVRGKPHPHLISNTYKRNTIRNTKREYNTPQDLTEADFKEIAERYQVPLAFVRSKYDDMELWAGERPSNGKVRGRNWRLTLMHWVKKDALELKTQAARKGGVYDATQVS